jgi:hypothetical protein
MTQTQEQKFLSIKIMISLFQEKILIFILSSTFSVREKFEGSFTKKLSISNIENETE